ncbi:MAG: DUF4445 domain-containing protein [Chloroflexi bacterium]|nr:DUF4445 domain-containing protein [Chloroflexota bacterium]
MSGLHLGLDLGTTSLVGCLWSAVGETVAAASCDNPQQVFGADVIQRMEVARKGKGKDLQRQLVAGINALVAQLLTEADCSLTQIRSASAAANPAISHLLADQPIDSILFPPHRPEFAAGDFLASAPLGLNLPVPLYLLPLISGYVGGDLLAVLLGSPPDERPTLYVDLGTNAELALWTGQDWLVTSVAAGPAFEAGSLACGMRYDHGAVTEVALVKDRFALTVAGGGPPKGICGSGLFALLSTARQAGLLAADGRIRAADEIDSNLARFLIADRQAWALQVYRDARTVLRVSQADVRAFQLAKGAVLAGVNCLLQRTGLQAEQLASVRIAGALGGALPVAALKGVAILPEIVLEKCRFLPGAVLAGLLHLQQEKGLVQARKLASSLKAYPLSGTPVFEKAFLASLDFS